jgi:AcrR family transcriptional regulator
VVEDPQDRRDARTALLDAAERILIEQGYPAATTRGVAAEAQVNHGLVHYYFGSVENLLLETLKRFTESLHERQRELFARDAPFSEKWRESMGHLLGSDAESGYSKLWLELQAMSWNNPGMRDHLVEVNQGWRQIVQEAIDGALVDYGVDRRRYPAEAVTALVMTFNLGVQMEAAGGIDQGHVALISMTERLVERLEREAKEGIS